MENTANIIRELASLYGIEILDSSFTHHVFVDPNGHEHPLKDVDFKAVFGLDGTSSGDILAPSFCRIKEIQTDFEIPNGVSTVFISQRSETLEPISNDQYLLAA